MRQTVLFAWLLALFVSGACSIHSETVVVGALTRVHAAGVGEEYGGSISLRNVGGVSEEVKVYVNDYLFYADGRNIYGEPGTNPRSNTAWLNYGPKQLTVAARASATISYSIRIPEDVSLRGTYWCILMVEVVPPASPEASGERGDKVAVGVTQVFRYGIQIVTHLRETGTRALSFAGTRLLKTDGGLELAIDAENTGERWLIAECWLELYAENGEHVGRYGGTALRIYPGTSVRFLVDVGDLGSGTYRALVVLDCGGDDVFGATYDLAIE